MMQVVEFFFGNFWHWLGLAIIVEIIFSGGLVRIIRVVNKEHKKED